jgi:hypothetical protein
MRRGCGRTGSAGNNGIPESWWFVTDILSESQFYRPKSFGASKRWAVRIRQTICTQCRGGCIVGDHLQSVSAMCSESHGDNEGTMRGISAG